MLIFSENVCENITICGWICVGFSSLGNMVHCYKGGFSKRSYLTMNTNLCFYLLCIKKCFKHINVLGDVIERFNIKLKFVVLGNTKEFRAINLVSLKFFSFFLEMYNANISSIFNQRVSVGVEDL